MTIRDLRTARAAAQQPTARIRRRLITWMLVAVGVAVLLLGVPLAAIVRQWAFSQELAQVRREARQIVGVLERERLAPSQFPTAVSLFAAALEARLTVLDLQGRVIRDSREVAPGTVFDDPIVAAAGRGQTASGALGDSLVVAAPAVITGTPVIVRLDEPAAAVDARTRSALFVILVLALAALAAGAALASWRARQLAEPLEALAQSARRLGQGDFSERAPRSDVTEIDHIALALDATAERLRTALERGASFSADASHQLRTPLTALRLNLEALAADLPTEHPQLEAAQAEIDRLEATIAELLELADAAVEPDVVDLRTLVLARLDAWRTLADAAQRAVRVTREPVPLVHARPGAVGQALQVLLDNALVHGRGDVTVWLEAVSRGGRSWVRLCVGDEGPGVEPEHLRSGDGRGLALATSLIEAEGGRLAIDSEHGGRVCLLLPSIAADKAPDEGDRDIEPVP